MGGGGVEITSTAGGTSVTAAAEELGRVDEMTTSRKDRAEPPEQSELGLSPPHRSSLERPREHKGGEETVADGERMATCAAVERVAAGLGVSTGAGAKVGEATGEGETLGIIFFLLLLCEFHLVVRHET